MNKIPCVAAINDLSGYGRVSLTEAIPILSAMGVEVCPLPTAVLSTHTYKFENYTFCDMTDEMKKITNHWEALGLKFDAICSGYLGSRGQIDIIYDFIDRLAKDALIVVDPVMGDNELYETQTVYSERMTEIIEGMKHLVKKADIITPNLTEAYLLLGEEYVKPPIKDKELCSLLLRLSSLGTDKVAISSVMTGKSEMCVALYDKTEGKFYKIDCGYVDRKFHGTGDIFAAVLTGAMLNGNSFVESANIAVGFIRESIAVTQALGEERIEKGVVFEPVLASYFAKTEYEKFYKEIKDC